MKLKHRIKRIVQLILLLIGYFLIFVIAQDISEFCILFLSYMFFCIHFFIKVFYEIKECIGGTK